MQDAITADRLPAAKHRADVPAARSAISDLVPETQAFRKHKPSKMAYAALRAIPESEFAAPSPPPPPPPPP